MPTAYLSPSLLRELTDVSVSNPGAGEAGRLLTWNGTAFVLRTSSESRTDLGLGTLATQNANAVAITGGAISGITPLPLASGGTNSNNGSITGTGALTFAAGGTNQNILLTPSGTGTLNFGSPTNRAAVEFYPPPYPAFEGPVSINLSNAGGTGGNGLFLKKGGGFFGLVDGFGVPDAFFPAFFGRNLNTQFPALLFIGQHRNPSEGGSSPFLGCIYFSARGQANANASFDLGEIAFYFANSGTALFTILGSGESRFLATTESTSTTTGALRIDGGLGVAKNLNIGGNLRFAGGTVPATATSAGTTGDVRYDGNHLYICTATNTWRRTALSTW